MPYLGNPAQQRFSSPRAASVYSGDGSTVAFTLEEVVTTDEDILVSVDGVIQEPSVAYAVSSGTTLTFTAAPSSNAGNNIFVYYIARTFGSVSMPDGQNVNAATASFSGDLTVDTNVLKVDTTNNRVGIGTASPTQLLQVESSTNSAEVQLRLRGLTSGGGGRSAVVGFDPSSTTSSENHTFIGDGSSKFLKVDNAGHVTMPLQPAFSVTPASNQDNIANTNTVAFGTEIFDQNADFASNVFTAPVTGRYQIDVNLGLLNVDSAAAFIGLDVHTSNRHYYSLIDPDFGQDAGYWELHFSGLVDMDASDTITIKFLQSGGTTQTDVEDAHTNFSGFLAC
jgi:hypothetical protein